MRCQQCGSQQGDYQSLFEHMKTHEGEYEIFPLEELDRFFFFQSSSKKAAIELKNKLNHMLRFEVDIEMRPSIQRWRQERLWGLILELSSLLDYYDDFDNIFRETNRRQMHTFSELNQILQDFIRNGTETRPEIRIDDV